MNSLFEETGCESKLHPRLVRERMRDRQRSNADTDAPSPAVLFDPNAAHTVEDELPCSIPEASPGASSVVVPMNVASLPLPLES